MRTTIDHSIDDWELYSLIKEGNRDAFSLFFVKYYSVLCTFGQHFVGTEDSEEIVQDLMVTLWMNRETQDIQTSLKSYLFQAVKNRCLTHISSNKRKQSLFEVLSEDLQLFYESSDNLYMEELTQNINRAVQNLPESYRVAFNKNRFEGKTYLEIAEELNVSPKTIDYRIQQALKLLRKKLAEHLLQWFF